MKPKLRFPGYEEEWEEKKLGDIATIVGGGTPATDVEEYWDGDIQWFTPSEIKNKYIGTSSRKITALGLQKSSAKLLPKNSILLTTRATLGEMSILKKEASTNQGFQSIIVNEDNNYEFIYYLQPLIKKQCYKKAAGSTFLEISKREIERIVVNLPSLHEQEKIGEFFSLLDQRIEKQEEKIELMKERKKGWMQKVFHQEIRFKDENGNDYPDWEEEKLGDIVNFENNRRKPITESDRKKGDYPYYGATGIVDYVDNYIFDGTRLLVGEDGADWSTFSKTAFIAKGQYWVNNHAHVIKSDKCNLIFLMNQLNYMELRKWVCGNAPAKLNLESIKSIILNLPSLPEQEKIANFLSVQDELIEKEEEKLSLLKEQKKGLLQQMFV